MSANDFRSVMAARPQSLVNGLTQSARAAMWNRRAFARAAATMLGFAGVVDTNYSHWQLHAREGYPTG